MFQAEKNEHSIAYGSISNLHGRIPLQLLLEPSVLILDLRGIDLFPNYGSDISVFRQHSIWQHLKPIIPVLGENIIVTQYLYP